jgi:lipid-A-disaccharide synthase
MPGSRPKEIEKNFPLLIEAFRRLRRDYPELTGVVAATRADLEPTLREIARRTPIAPGCADRCVDGWPEGVTIVADATDAATRWCDLALVVSGTVTLQIARQGKPMVIVYKSSRLMYWAIARWLLSTPFFSLPNLIAGERIAPELIPHFGGPERIVDEAVAMLERPELGERQRSALRGVAGQYDGTHAARGAAEAIATVAGLSPAADQNGAGSPPASASIASGS